MIFSRVCSFIFFLVSLGLFAGAKPITVEAGLDIREEIVGDKALAARGNTGQDLVNILVALEAQIKAEVALFHGGRTLNPNLALLLESHQ